MLSFIKNSLFFIFVAFYSIFLVCGFSNSLTYQEYCGKIYHLTFNTLISFPDKFFQQKNTTSNILEEEKITPSEFKKILNNLHSNNYILINPFDLFFYENNKFYSKKLLIPKNKKPIIFSFNNVSYGNKNSAGEIDKIILDNNNQIATYSTKQSIQDRISYDNSFITILEEFIKSNPDFSHNNAKGIIFFTAKNNILGYNINKKNASIKHDTKRVSQVIYKLKKLGWIFGSNNYSVKDENLISDMEFTKDISLWQHSLTEIVGNTTLYASMQDDTFTKSDTKLNTLINNNFNVIFYNNHTPQLHIKNNCVLMSRLLVSGYTLRQHKDDFNELFDPKIIYDHNTRTIPFHQST